MRTQRRRRREAKTDYKARLALLKSEKPRLIIRKTNRYIIVQLVQSEIAQDKTLVRVTSKDLLEKGWPKEQAGSLKNLAASYLTGFLLVKKLKEKPDSAILDIGLHRNISKSRIYAVLKGALDAGLKIPHNEDALPSTEKIKSTDKTNALEKIKDLSSPQREASQRSEKARSKSESEKEEL